MARLWLNATLLPVAATLDAVEALTPTRPADDSESGAPEGADVVNLADYRRTAER